jgi:adenine phosphoribosyltransferase
MSRFQTPDHVAERAERLHARLRPVPDFPKPGIVFQDIGPLLADAEGLREAIDAMAEPWREQPPAIVAGIESRGFIFGTALALQLGAGFVPLRKPGKLPGPVLERRYALEYGEDALQLQAGRIARGQRVLLVDDVLATGGTAAAACALLAEAGAEVAGLSVLVALEALEGRARLPAGLRVEAALALR